MQNDLKFAIASPLGTGASVTASADIGGINQLAGVLILGTSATTGKTASLVLSVYDSTSASSGTSLTTLIGTSQIATQTIGTAAAITLGFNVPVSAKGRYLYAVVTQNGAAEAALNVMGMKLDGGVTDATGMGVTAATFTTA